MYSPERAALDRLLELLRELERVCVPEHERSILEVARASLLEEISLLSHRLRDDDYYRLGDDCEVGPR